jgi:GDPmannose 4,6-dehydratase
MRKALITGITGQDGAYLARLLIAKGYEVHGIKRRSSSFNTGRIDGIYRDPHDKKNNLFLHHGDMADGNALIRIIGEVQPEEIYNLAAMSHVHVSFEMPEYTANTVGIGTLKLLEAIRILRLEVKTKIYQASSSELYGKVVQTPQSEITPFNPRSPYAIAKQYAFWITKNYREAYGIFASNGILFNHESPLRGETFVTRKITLALGKIIRKEAKKIYLGNLDARRDWGHAKDYVNAMWKILQHNKPDDFVISTGFCYSVRDFAIHTFNYCGIELVFKGKGIKEKGFVDNIKKTGINIIDDLVKKNIKVGQCVIEVDSYYFRPTEVELLVGDASKAKTELKWVPEISFLDLINDMCNVDILRKPVNFDL